MPVLHGLGRHAAHGWFGGGLSGAQTGRIPSLSYLGAFRAQGANWAHGRKMGAWAQSGRGAQSGRMGATWAPPGSLPPFLLWQDQLSAPQLWDPPVGASVPGASSWPATAAGRMGGPRVGPASCVHATGALLLQERPCRSSRGVFPIFSYILYLKRDIIIISSELHSSIA